MEIINEFYKRLNELDKDIIKAIKNLVKKENIESINFLPYVQEGYVDAYNFYGCDKNGYGISYQIESISFIEKDEKFDMVAHLSDNDDYYNETWNFSDTNTDEKLYILTMIGDVVDSSKQSNLPILKENEFFEDFDVLARLSRLM